MFENVDRVKGRFLHYAIFKVVVDRVPNSNSYSL